VHQVLARPPGSGPPPEPWEPEQDELEFFLNDVADGVWVCRRDPSVRRPVAEVQFTSASGIPTVAPEIQLLYKARHHKDKDEHDFRGAVGRMSADQRAWLQGALEVVHPGDPWLNELA
jgi:hypothetical protein